MLPFVFIYFHSSSLGETASFFSLRKISFPFTVLQLLIFRPAALQWLTCFLFIPYTTAQLLSILYSFLFFSSFPFSFSLFSTRMGNGV
jgi:hypothetical protein